MIPVPQPAQPPRPAQPVLPLRTRRAPRPVDDSLVLLVEHHGDHVTLVLAGELDRANAARVSSAVEWIRRRHQGTIVLDLHSLTFVDLAGHRAIRRAACGPDGAPDPRVLRVVGPAVARFEHLLALTRR